jgi:hypothetical protein
MDQPRQNLNGLKALVGGLGVLVILGTALVISVVIHRLYAKPAAPSMTPRAASAPAIANRLPPGDSIRSIAAAGQALAIWITTPTGDQILLLNPASGSLTLAIATAR